MRLLWLFVLMSLGLACSPRSGADGQGSDGGTASSDASTLDTGTKTGAANDTSSTAGDTETETGTVSVLADLPAGPISARGITIATVEVNQGPAVVIGRENAGVEAAERTAPVVADRDTVIRLFWDITDDESWETRDIEAVLTLEQEDGTTDVAPLKRSVESDSYVGSVSSTFWWFVPGDKIQPGSELSIELLETDRSFGRLPEPKTPPKIPLEGTVPIGVEEGDHMIGVHVVPIIHEWMDCKHEITFTEADAKVYEEALYSLNPVEKVEITIGDPITWTSNTKSFGPLLTHLSRLRGDFGVEPNVHVYGIIDGCDPGPKDVAGQAIGVPGERKGESYLRVALGRYRSATGSAGTMTHEIGHTSGRYHVKCSGEEKNTDPRYPHEGGRIGVWGFNVLTQSVYLPSKRADLLSYCYPRWISDYGWTQMWENIRVLSTWSDDQEMPDRADDSVLVGALYPDGSEDWWTTRGTMPVNAAPSSTTFEFTVSGKMVGSSESVQFTQPHGKTTMIVARLPATIGTSMNVTRIDKGHRKPIARDKLKILHTPAR